MTEKDVYTIELDVETKKNLTLCLFTQVQNASELRKKVICGELRCCLLKAALIVDPFQVIIAVNKAVLSEKYSKLITRTLFTEILYNLSTSKNISQSLMTFGISDEDTEILVALVHDYDERESQIEKINDAIKKGQIVSLSQLQHICDVAQVKKLYKIDNVELGTSNLINSITSRISTKDFISMK